MAMAKTVDHDCGVQTTYHRIEALQSKRAGENFDVAVLIGSYLDKEAAGSGKAPVAVVQAQFSVPRSDGEPTLASVYGLLTAPIAQHSYEDTDYGDRDDGSWGQVLVTRTVSDQRSVTGFNDCPEV